MKENLFEMYARMCEFYNNGYYCSADCEIGKMLKEKGCQYIYPACVNLMHILNHNEIEYCVKIVEEWAKKHPRKTRAEELKRLFPNSSVESLCIQLFDTSIEKCDGNCPECIEKFWNEEVVEESEVK